MLLHELIRGSFKYGSLASYHIQFGVRATVVEWLRMHAFCQEYKAHVSIKTTSTTTESQHELSTVICV